MRPCGPTTKGSERAFQLRSASAGSCSAGLGRRARQLRPSSVEMSVPLGPTVIQDLRSSVISHGRAEAVGWGLRGLPGHSDVRAESSRARGVVRLLRVPANGHAERIVLECDGEDTRGRIVPRDGNTDLVPVGQLVVGVYVGVLVDKVVESAPPGPLVPNHISGLGSGWMSFGERQDELLTAKAWNAVHCSETRLGVLIALSLQSVVAGRVLRGAEGEMPVDRVAQNIAIAVRCGSASRPTSRRCWGW